MSGMDIKRAGIISNRIKDNGLKGAMLVAQRLRKRGIDVSFDEGTIPEGENEATDYEKIDCLFVLGGDGTILKAARKASFTNVSMLGINLGRLGFLTEIELNDIDKAITDIINGDCIIEKRIMLDCGIYKDGKELYRIEALNDIAVMKKDLARTIFVRIAVNGAVIDKFNCDGMLVSTPTGSTGYSLSSGGPIISPEIECLLATPICAHSLYSRPTVVPAEDEVTIEPFSHRGMVLVSDGAVNRDINEGEIVKVTKSKRHASFIRFHENYFYPLLRSKFKDWIDE